MTRLLKFSRSSQDRRSLSQFHRSYDGVLHVVDRLSVRGHACVSLVDVGNPYARGLSLLLWLLALFLLLRCMERLISGTVQRLHGDFEYLPHK